jgi:DNA-binding transcriptional LysR family regulator
MQILGSDLRLLRVFDAVVRHKGFAAAQAALNIRQSTISNHMQALESRLGVTLCTRGRGGFALTEEGRVAHDATVRVLMAMDGFVGETETLHGRLVGRLRVGIADSVVTDPDFRIPEAIARIEGRYPGVRLEFRHGSPQTLQSGLLDGDLHVAVGSFPHKVRGLAYRHLYNELNTLYCGRGHAVFDQPQASITADNIAKHKAAGRTYWRPDHHNNRIFLRTTAVAEGVEQQLMLILSGAYLGYIPDHAAEPWIGEGALRQVRPDLFSYSCPFDVATKPPASRSALADAFIEDLFEVYDLTPQPNAQYIGDGDYIDDTQSLD